VRRHFIPDRYQIACFESTIDLEFTAGKLNHSRSGTREAIVPDYYHRRLGAFVRERRKAAGLSQTELGELARVGTRFISELERGKSSVRLQVVNQVLAVFGKALGIVDAPQEDEPI
jgi:y4mF family transcriptional regulator